MKRRTRLAVGTLIYLLSLYALGATLGWAGETASGKNCKVEENYPLISVTELQEVLRQQPAPFVVDVNSRESFAKSSVTGAIHYGSHRNDFVKMLPHDKSALIVSYCGGPQCTAWQKAAEEACEQGYTNIRHFKAGIKGWDAAMKKTGKI